MTLKNLQNETNTNQHKTKMHRTKQRQLIKHWHGTAAYLYLSSMRGLRDKASNEKRCKSTHIPTT